MTILRTIRVLLAASMLVLAPSLAHAGECCVVPDNGAGTAALPPNCPFGFTGGGEILDGLPPGEPVLISACLHSFFNVVPTPGGALGGEVQAWNATLDMNLTGKGA